MTEQGRGRVGDRIRDVLSRLWGKSKALLSDWALRPHPHGLKAESRAARSRREQAFEAADKAESKLGSVRIIIASADGALDVLHRGHRDHGHKNGDR